MTNDPAIRDRIFGQILGEVEGSGLDPDTISRGLWD
jgi:hypothetical protein